MQTETRPDIQTETQPNIQIELEDSSYGKSNVKFLKVKKDSTNPLIQEVLEANVQILLRGDFDSSYTKSDNSKIIPTDTIKNIIIIEAKVTDVWPIERFAAHLAKLFTTKYNHINGIEIEISQLKWNKYEVNGKLHDHSFKYEGPETRRTFLSYSKIDKKLILNSSIKDLRVLKSTGSMFYGYSDCDCTTLKPTTDRILSSDIFASWIFDSNFIKSLDDIIIKSDEGLFDSTYQTVRQITLNLFALEKSNSIQATMYHISNEVLKNIPEIKKISYELPNNHYILFELKWKDIINNNLYYPVTGRNGLIKSTVARKL